MKNKGRLDRFILEVWYFWRTVQLQKSLLIYINWKQLKINLTFTDRGFKPNPNLASICNSLVRLECLPSASSLQRIQSIDSCPQFQLETFVVVASEFPDSVLSSISSDDDPRPQAAHSNNLWKWQGLCRWSQFFLVWFLGENRIQQGVSHCFLSWSEMERAASPFFFLGGRRWRGTGQQNETTTSTPVGGCSQPRLWPGGGRVKEGIRNQETTFIPKVALWFKPAGQTLNPTRKQDSFLTWQGQIREHLAQIQLICTNTDCRSNIQAQLWSFSQVKPLLYIIFKIHEPPTHLDPSQKTLRGKQILLEYFITLCMRRALLKSLHYCTCLD